MCGQVFQSVTEPTPTSDGRPRYDLAGVKDSTMHAFLLAYLAFRENHDSDPAPVEAAYGKLRDEAFVATPENAALKIADLLREELCPDVTGQGREITITGAVAERIRELTDRTRPPAKKPERWGIFYVEPKGLADRSGDLPGEYSSEAAARAAIVYPTPRGAPRPIIGHHEPRRLTD